MSPGGSWRARLPGLGRVSGWGIPRGVRTAVIVLMAGLAAPWLLMVSVRYIDFVAWVVLRACVGR